MADSNVPEVKFQDVQDGLKNNTITLLDVRGLAEIQKDGKIANSIHIPVSEMKDALKLSNEEFENRFKAKKPSTTDKIVCHCHAGKRAVMATEIAAELGYKASSYTGSFQDWVSKGGAVSH